MVALFMVATFLLFLAVDFIVQRRAARHTSVAADRIRATSPERFLIPRGYFFSPNHSWVQLLPSGKVRIGIDDFIQKVVGAIDEITTLPRSAVVRKGEPILTLKQGDRMLSFTAPISGRIVEVNEDLTHSPSRIKNDPYTAGWIAMIEPENLVGELKTLDIADASAKWLRQEVARFRDFIKSHTPQFVSAQVGVTMADGGMPMGGALQHADTLAWHEFEEEFLRTN